MRKYQISIIEKCNGKRLHRLWDTVDTGNIHKHMYDEYGADIDTKRPCDLGEQDESEFWDNYPRCGFVFATFVSAWGTEYHVEDVTRSEAI